MIHNLQNISLNRVLYVVVENIPFSGLSRGWLMVLFSFVMESMLVKVAVVSLSNDFVLHHYPSH